MDKIKSKYPIDDERYRVLLIQPPLPANKRHKKVFPLALVSIASTLWERDPSLNIGILDAHVMDLTYPEIITEIGRVEWDIIGISYWTVQADIAANISRGIKNIWPNTVIVHGGVHATVCPEDALKTADFVVMHEGEETFLELVKAVIKVESPKKIAGIAWNEGGNTVKNPPRPFIKDLDSIPFPNFNLINVELYNTPLHIVGGSRFPIIGSRGCPYKCSYCSSPVMWRGTVRFRSADNIVNEMKSIVEKHGIAQFHFWDDNFTIKPDRIRELCKQIIDEKLNIKWVCLDRAELINKNKDLLPIMRKAGCIGIEIGLESSNPDTFIHIQKKQKLEEGKNAVKNLKINDIIPLYTCMAFNPGETIMGYYFQKQHLDEVQDKLGWYDFFHPFPFSLYIGQFATAYPGTKFFDDIKLVSEELIERREDRFHHQINSVPHSLLSDVPLRTFENLLEWHYILFIYAIEVAFYIKYDRRNNFDEMACKHFEAWKFVYPFFRRCNGRLTVKEIALELSDYLKISKISSMRMTCFAVYIFSQLGMIRSGLYYLNYNVKQKSVVIPQERFAQTYLWLGKYGIYPNNIIESNDL